MSNTLGAEQPQVAVSSVEDPLSTAVDDILESESVNVALLEKSSNEQQEEATASSEKPCPEQASYPGGYNAPTGGQKVDESSVEAVVPPPLANTLSPTVNPILFPHQQMFPTFPSVLYTPMLQAPSQVPPGFQPQAVMAPPCVGISAPVQSNIPIHAYHSQPPFPAQNYQAAIRHPPSYSTVGQTQENLAVFTSQPTQAVADRMLPEYTSKQTMCWCPRCGENVLTKTTPVAGPCTTVMCIALCLFFGILCAIVPFLFRSCQDIKHTCPRCGQRLLYYKRCKI